MIINIVVLLPFALSMMQEDSTPDKLFIGSAFYPPLSNPEQNGYVDLIVKEACARVGVEVEIIQLPAQRSLSNANLGIDDGDILRIGGMETRYPNLVPVPEPLVKFEFVAFSRGVEFTPDGWDSLRPFNVGIVTGWKILEEKVVETASLTKTRNSVQLFRMLQTGRLDLAVYNRIEGEWLARKLGFRTIKALHPPLAERDMYLYLHKKHSELAVRLGQQIRAMKEDGIFEAIKEMTITRLESENQ